MRFLMPFARQASSILSATQEVDVSLIRELLTFRNWRPRLVGAYFAAILRAKSTLDVIEPLLLRSDVCYAGRGYCLALARMNAQRSPDILEGYLDYYLTKANLWFDQDQGLAALRHLDAINGTSRAARYEPLWSEFVVNKPSWDLARAVEGFQHTLSGLQACADRG